jgi:hypothetical protein
MLKKIIKSSEFITFSIIVLLSLVIGFINPAFFSLATLFDVLRASIVLSIMAFGLLLVIIAGGIDISFVAFSALAAYGTHMFLLSRGYQGGIFLYYLIACTIGLLAGLLSGWIITRFNLPIFDVSLAMMTMWYGFIRFFIGSTKNFKLPEGAVGYYSKFLVTVERPLCGRGRAAPIDFVCVDYRCADSLPAEIHHPGARHLCHGRQPRGGHPLGFQRQTNIDGGCWYPGRAFSLCRGDAQLLEPPF